MKNPVRIAALTIVTALALSGCIKMEMNFDLQSDNTVDGDFIFAVQEGVGELMELTDEEAADEIFGNDDLTEDFVNARAERYEADGYIGTRIIFEDQPLDDLDADTGGVTFVREGDEFVVSGPFEEGGNDDEVPEGAIMTMSVTFPGAVSDHNGTLSGNTVTWDLLDPPAELHARGNAVGSGGGDSSMLMIAGIILAILVVGGIITVIVVRSRQGSAAAVTPGGGVPASEAPPGLTPGTTFEPTDGAEPPKS